MGSKKYLCPHAKKCGGCQLQNLSYPEQLSLKQRKTIGLLGKFHRVEEIIGMAHPYHYRNKVQAAFGVTRGGEVISGVYQSGSHRIVKVDSCLTEDETADRIIVTIRNLLIKFRIKAYNEYNETGVLRHVLVKRGFATNQVMVVLVTATQIMPARRNFVNALLKAHPEITTVIHNYNPGRTNLVLGEQEQVLYGKGTIEDVLCGRRFLISAKSFYQINPVQTEILYGKAMEFADLKPTDRVLDAYCGIGTIGLVAAPHVREVIGVELNKTAVKDAIRNARLNETTNAKFYAADAGDFMLGMAQDKEQVDVVFMDPPRAGSSQAFLSSVATLAPEKVVYISCNPETQARDLLFLVKHGYKVRKIQPVDMFPHTEHVESVVLLSRR